MPTVAPKVLFKGALLNVDFSCIVCYSEVLLGVQGLFFISESHNCSVHSSDFVRNAATAIVAPTLVHAGTACSSKLALDVCFALLQYAVTLARCPTWLQSFRCQQPCPLDFPTICSLKGIWGICWRCANACVPEPTYPLFHMRWANMRWRSCWVCGKAFDCRENLQPMTFDLTSRIIMAAPSIIPAQLRHYHQILPPCCAELFWHFGN